MEEDINGIGDPHILVRNILDYINMHIPVKTGALKRSVNVTYNMHSANELQINLEMLIYGYFQNYGVGGFKGNKGIRAVDTRWGVIPRNGSYFMFRHDLGTRESKYEGYGLGFAAQKFIPELGDFFPGVGNTYPPPPSEPLAQEFKQSYGSKLKQFFTDVLDAVAREILEGLFEGETTYAPEEEQVIKITLEKPLREPVITYAEIPEEERKILSYEITYTSTPALSSSFSTSTGKIRFAEPTYAQGGGQVKYFEGLTKDKVSVQNRNIGGGTRTRSLVTLAHEELKRSQAKEVKRVQNRERGMFAKGFKPWAKVPA